MGTVQSLGIGSGLNINEIVTALVDAEKVPAETSLDNRKTEAEAKISSYGEYKSKLSALQTSLSNLRVQTNFNQIDATSSDTSAFTASASSIAQTGSYSVVVNEVAQSQVLSTAAYSTVNDTIGTGTLTLKFGTTSTGPYGFMQDTSAAEKTINVDAENNSLSTLRDYINSGSYGVDASIVNDGTGYRLVLTAAAGADNSLQVVVSGDGDGDDEDTSGLSALRYDETLQAMTQNVDATDASFSVNGIPITSESNSVSTAVNGITFNLLAKDAGVTKTLTISKDTSQFKEQIEGFVTAYNEVATLVDTLTDYDPTTQTAGIFAGDSTIRNSFSQLRSVMFDSVTGVGTPLKALTDIGVLSSRNDGTIELETDALNSVLSQPEQLGNLFSLSGSASDALVSYVSATSQTKAGTYYLNLTQVATRAQLQGDSVLPFNTPGTLDIDEDNDQIQVRVDGILSGAISLTQQTYNSGDELATEIQSKINADSLISGAGVSVTVSYDSANNRFDLYSNLYGSSSTVAVTAVDTNTEAQLGFAEAAGVNGKDVDGSVSTTQASQAEYSTTGILPFSTGGSIDIDGDNDEFSIRIDDTTSGTITLTPGNYASGANLAADIQAQINADATLSAASKAVTVSYDSTNNRFDIKSNTYGSASRVEMLSIDTRSAAELGFYQGNGSPGTGTIASTNTSGDGRYLVVTSGDANGLKIDVGGGSYNSVYGVNRGSIVFSRGVADKLDQFISSILEDGGIIDSRTSGLQSTIADVDSEKQDLNRYIVKLETRLVAQFSAMDALVGQLNNISNFLTSSLSALPGARSSSGRGSSAG